MDNLNSTLSKGEIKMELIKPHGYSQSISYVASTQYEDLTPDDKRKYLEA
jgi:hypothetical protein